MAGYPYNYTGYDPYNQNQFTYYPQAYSPASQPVQQGSGIIWVQGEAGAKSYLVGAGKSALLMDSESSSFYIKSTDPSGMPQPLRIFDYSERLPQNSAIEIPPEAAEIDMSQYITRDEFQKLTDKLKATIRKEIKDARESSV